jgi:hypothetical protein
MVQPGRASKSRKFAIGTAVLTVVSALIILASAFAPAAEAARGGNGGGGKKGGGGGSTPTATLVVSPNPVPADSTFQITGCGYYVAQDVGVLFILSSSAGTAMWSALIDPATGCIVDASGWAGSPGGATLEARQYVNGTTAIMGRTTFTIQ